MMRQLLFLVLMLHASFARAEPLLKVGMDLSSPPFETVRDTGDPCGISIDMADALGEFLDRQTKIDNIAFIGLIPSLKNGKIDLIISSMTDTTERRKSIDFSIPYATIGLCLLVSSQSSLKDIADANKPGRVIVVKSGTSGEIYATTKLTQATVRVLDKEAMCVLEVVQGKADAFIYDQISVYTLWQRNPKTTRAVLAPFQQEQWAIGIRKGRPHLVEQVNQFITTFRQQGGFDRLSDKYLSKQKAAFQKLEIPFIF